MANPRTSARRNPATRMKLIRLRQTEHTRKSGVAYRIQLRERGLEMFQLMSKKELSRLGIKECQGHYVTFPPGGNYTAFRTLPQL